MEKSEYLLGIKKKNRDLIKETIYRCGPISRIDLARHLSLTCPTITSNVAALLETGLVQEVGIPNPTDEKPLGRRPILLDIAARGHYVVGVELGPYETQIVVCNLRGSVFYHAAGELPRSHYREMIKGLVAFIVKTIAESGVPSDKIMGIGIGLPGYVDAEAGTVHNNLRQDWVAREIVSDMKKELPYPICIENNVRARTIGADLFAKKVNGDPLLYYFVSYGLACTLVVGQQIITGKANGAGEIGHMVVEINGPHCDTCGNNGCLETVASEKAIIKRCQALLDSGNSALLRDICSESGGLTIDAVLKAQTCGDPMVTSILRDAVRYIAVNIANLMNFVNPEDVLIDGRIFSVEQNRETLLSILPHNVFDGSVKKYHLRFIKYDKLRGAKGAAAVSVKKFIIG